MEEQKNNSGNAVSSADNTPKVKGIGGIFFFSENTKEIKEWYVNNLGFEINDWGSVSFEYRDLHKPEVIIPLQWNPFKKDSDYFAPSKKEFMINYRVQNIEGMVNNLKEKGIIVVDEITNYEGVGKFVHIMDAEGNKIELWEPE
ncbi:MAG: VOC family protein [Bacteroidota bacterium]